MPNPPSGATTNTQPESQKIEPKKVLTFAELKANYPSNYPCNKDVFDDQCAIKVSASLQGAGVSLKTFQGATCWFHKDTKHVLRAEELANWLKKRYLANWPEPTVITGADWQTKANGKTGVIFFKDYWLRKGEKSPTGDHIDLWDEDELVSGGIAGFARFTLGVDSASLPWPFDDRSYSDLGKSQAIWLWEIK